MDVEDDVGYDEHLFPMDVLVTWCGLWVGLTLGPDTFHCQPSVIPSIESQVFQAHDEY